MDNFLKTLVNKLPLRFTITIVLIIIGWFGFLTGVALFTKRSVEFFPPKIGSDLALQTQIQELSKNILQIAQAEQAHRTQLQVALDNARNKSLEVSEKMSVGMSEARENVQQSSDAVRAEDEKFLLEIEALRKDVQRLSEKF